ncbi:MAG: substrate-binding domain-containing protein [Gammaproteobacteria bacterium]|nr:substrate-binding domain-containing protein [Gammaproteobacteria bacterium]MDE2251943.1 substrate-binding domain-containing protein [Gammaproteobacteria bacterium]
MNKKRRETPARMSDIARLAGVSASTVSRALAGSPLVAAAKREEIRRLARERGYVINSTARNLRLQRTQAISVAIPLGHETSQPLTDPFFTEMLGHLADCITQRGYGMFLQKVVPPMDDWLLRLIGSHKSDGIVVIGQSTEHAALEEAAARYKPLVVWGGHLPRQSYCTVGTDNVAGARAAVEHLIALGRRRIVFLGDPAVPEVGLRYEGYRLAHERAARQGIQPHIVPAHLTADTAYEAMRAFIGSAGSFDAVFGATDVIALSAVRAITAAGMSVPRDVAVAGYDDISFAAHANPPLTTVRQDLQRGARMLIDLLFRRMAGEDAPSATMPAELILRESTGRIDVLSVNRP